jgi:hypothetical protein
MERRGRPSDYDDRDYLQPRRLSPDVEFRERTRRVAVSRSPPRRRLVVDDLRDPRAEGGELVLRQREVETITRPRRRSPSPLYRERVIRTRARSFTPPPAFERERARSPSRVRMTVERRVSLTDSSSSDSSDEHERIRTRIVERQKERVRTPSPKVVKGPIVEREVITHYTDVDHGKRFGIFPQE